MDRPVQATETAPAELTVQDWWLKRHGDEVIVVIVTDAGVYTNPNPNDPEDPAAEFDITSDLESLMRDPQARPVVDGRLHLMWSGLRTLTRID